MIQEAGSADSKVASGGSQPDFFNTIGAKRTLRGRVGLLLLGHFAGMGSNPERLPAIRSSRLLVSDGARLF
jgi:hypothetical protein